MHALLSLAVVQVLTQHYDLARTGANLNETILDTTNVNSATFGKLFTRDVDGMVYAQPLIVSGLALSGGPRNVVFVATMHNSVYAFDADDPGATAPIWHASLENSVPLPDPLIGTACQPVYADISVEIGILSTPVIDPVAGLIYVVTASKDETGYHHNLHALDILTGEDRLNGPVTVSASVMGTGVGSVNGTIAFQSAYEDQRPGLLLTAGRIYIGFASYCDTEPCHGWLLSYDATTLDQSGTFNATPNGDQGGVWQSGQGLSVDDEGNIYVVTGDGPFDYNIGGRDIGDTVIKMSPDLDILDWFTPYNFGQLYTADLDLGTSGALLMPGTNAVLAGGKQGKIYILDRANLGHTMTGDTQIPQSIQLAPAAHIYASPVSWVGPDGPRSYIWAGQDYLRAFQWNGTDFDPTPTVGSYLANGFVPGGMLSISANGQTPGTGILWANVPISGSANHAVIPGVLRAFDAADVTKELWDSQMNPHDAAGSLAKFNSAVVANGKVYLGTFSNQLVVYGLDQPVTQLDASPSPAVYADTVTLTAQVTTSNDVIPSGSVSFDDDGIVFGTATLDGTGTATIAVDVASTRTYTFGATYLGDSLSNGSPRATIEEVVQPAPCTAQLTAQPTTYTPGTPIVLTGRVFPHPVSAVTGTVTFIDGTTLLGTANLGVGGMASLSVPTLAVGRRELAVAYSGDTNHLSCTSPPVEVDSLGVPVVTVVATPNPVELPAMVDLAITVAATGDDTPTGVVSVVEGTQAVGNAFLDVTGMAHVTYAPMTPGSHTLTVSYAGDADFQAASASPTVVTVTGMVAPTMTTTTLTSTGGTGGVYSLAAHVEAADGSYVMGQVTFTDGTDTLDAVPLDGLGYARLDTPSLTPGTHSIVATFAPSASNLSASQSAPLVLTVVGPPDAGAPDAAPVIVSDSGGGCSVSAASAHGHGAAGVLVILSFVGILRARRRQSRGQVSLTPGEALEAGVGVWGSYKGSSRPKGDPEGLP